MPFRVIVKGDKFEAARAAAKRGIPLVFVAEVFNGRETTGDVPDDFLEPVVSWFLEAPHNPPYPAGTLLSYSGVRH